MPAHPTWPIRRVPEGMPPFQNGLCISCKAAQRETHSLFCKVCTIAFTQGPVECFNGPVVNQNAPFECGEAVVTS